MLKSVLFVTLTLVMATSAYADATQTGPIVVAPVGKVLVNQGGGFVPAIDGLTLKFNDRIMVSKDAAVTLAYAKCSVALKPGTLLTLPKGDLCGKSSAALQNSAYVQIAPVASTATGDGVACTTACTGGLAFVAGVAAVAVYETISKR